MQYGVRSEGRSLAEAVSRWHMHIINCRSSAVWRCALWVFRNQCLANIRLPLVRRLHDPDALNNAILIFWIQAWIQTVECTANIFAAR